MFHFIGGRGPHILFRSFFFYLKFGFVLIVVLETDRGGDVVIISYIPKQDLWNICLARGILHVVWENFTSIFFDAGVTISFILAGVSCILNALCYAELATRFPPVVGGAYLYAYTAFNELTAFLVFAQLMLDYHIGAASIARSLAGYIVSFLEIFPFFKDNIPNWLGNGQEFFGGVVSINVLAPVLLALLTFILCWGVGESSTINSIMTSLKVFFHSTYICIGIR